MARPASAGRKNWALISGPVFFSLGLGFPICDEIADPSVHLALGMLPATLLALSANRAEISTGNLKSDVGKFDNFKAQWEKPLRLGDWKTTLNAKYDYNANKDFLKEISLSGGIVEAISAGDVDVDYEVKRDFSSRQTDVKLTGARTCSSLPYWHAPSHPTPRPPPRQLRRATTC
jgi:hypothetical protein